MTDRLTTITTALAVVTVAVVAAIISYQHAYELVRPRRGVAQKRRERVEGPGIRRGRSGPGPLRAPGAQAICWPSSSCQRVSGCWMCSPSSARGSAC